jgi:hypothetical protein
VLSDEKHPLECEDCDESKKKEEIKIKESFKRAKKLIKISLDYPLTSLHCTYNPMHVKEIRENQQQISRYVNSCINDF